MRWLLGALTGFDHRPGKTKHLARAKALKRAPLLLLEPSASMTIEYLSSETGTAGGNEERSKEIH